MNKNSEKEFPEPYYAGRDARGEGDTREACRFRALSEKRSWWLAGWHDMDMEMESEK